MNKRNALIFSKNETLSKIVSSELSLLGYAPKVFSEVPSVKDAELIIFDATELELSAAVRSFIASLAEARKIAITSNSSAKLSTRFDKILVFPFLLSNFRGAVIDSGESTGNDEVRAFALSKCFTADKNKKGVFLNEVFVSLSDYEFTLLELLCRNSGSCVSRADILGLFGAGDSNIADVYICHLRNKLEIPFGIKVIYTVRGKGYMTDYFIK